MAPKFPNPDPATDSVRDRLNQFIEVAGRAVYPPLAVAPSPTTPGQVWWDVSSTVKIRDEANAGWASLATTMGAVSFKEPQSLTSGERTQALTNIGAQPAGSYQTAGGYVRYDQAQSLTTAQLNQARNNTSNRSLSVGGEWGWNTDALAVTTIYTNTTGSDMLFVFRGSLAIGARFEIQVDGRVCSVCLSESVPHTPAGLVYVPNGSTYQVLTVGSVTSLTFLRYMRS